jgi:hypothetical protein
MQAQVKQGFLRDNWLSLLVGFAAGVYHVGVFVFLSAGTGGPKHGGALLPYVFFGYGSLVWFVLPPIQYACYAYMARHRLKKAAGIASLLHYGSAVALMVYFGPAGSLLPEPEARDLGINVMTFILFYGPFLVLNVYFFRRIFARTQSPMQKSVDER